MKIRKIKFINHPIFGTLEFDFTDKDGQIIDTIIIAGENGTGKSMLLNTIYELTSQSMSNNLRDEQRAFEVCFSQKEIEILKQTDFKHYFGEVSPKDNIFRISINYNLSDTRQVTYEALTEKGVWILLPSNFFYHYNTKKVYRAIFSDVEINFTPKEINTVGSKNIDIDSNQNERSNQNLATEITQLLIDVQSLDALEFAEWARKNLDKTIDESKLDTRIKRFTHAFDYMFPTKKYEKIETNNGRKYVIFNENGRKMDVSQLSSGEKQIVFRGGFLLKDKESSKGALVLIDEPEISLHPNWQLKILNFFKKLFTDDTGGQTSQLIVATHSPFIVHNANRKDDKVIILQKDGSCRTIIPPDQKFYTWSNEKIVQEAFKISDLFSSKKTTVFVEGETDEKYFDKSIEVFGRHNLPIEFKWIGRINDKGNAENTGDTALNQAKTFFTANMEQIRHKIILLYDCDTNKPEEDIQNLHIRKMAHCSNTIFKKGVENLLVLPAGNELSQFYKKKIKIDDYGAESASAGEVDHPAPV